MALNFAVYESTTLADLGTPAQAVGKGGSLAFIPKNLVNAAKRVAVVLKNKKGESTVVSCSEGVSAMVRKALAGGMEKKKALAIISKLSILEGDAEVPYICAPAGEGGNLEEFTVELLAKDTVANYEELVAF
jgi:hypothetical protein